MASWYTFVFHRLNHISNIWVPFFFFPNIPPGHFLLLQYALISLRPTEKPLPRDTWGQSPYFLDFESPSWWTHLFCRSTFSGGDTEGLMAAVLDDKELSCASSLDSAWHTAILLGSLFTLILESFFTSLQDNCTARGTKSTLT